MTSFTFFGAVVGAVGVMTRVIAAMDDCFGFYVAEALQCQFRIVFVNVRPVFREIPLSDFQRDDVIGRILEDVECRVLECKYSVKSIPKGVIVR